MLVVPETVRFPLWNVVPVMVPFTVALPSVISEAVNVPAIDVVPEVEE